MYACMRVYMHIYTLMCTYTAPNAARHTQMPRIARVFGRLYKGMLHTRQACNTRDKPATHATSLQHALQHTRQHTLQHTSNALSLARAWAALEIGAFTTGAVGGVTLPLHLYTYIYMLTCTCMYIHIHAYICMYIHVYIYIYICIYTYIHKCIYIYIYTCVHMYTYT